MAKKPALRLVAPSEDDKPKIAPPITATGGEIQDIITLPATSRDRVGSIGAAALAIRPLSGMYTTRSARKLAVQHLANIITHATALQAYLASLGD